MLSFLPAPLVLLLNAVLIPANAILIATPMQILGILRLLLPLRGATAAIEAFNYYLYRLWVFDNYLILKLTCRLNWHVDGDPIPRVKGTCMVLSNHLSWADILILCLLYRGRIPTTKFFMKRSLLYIPFVGLACYAIGMPFMHRYRPETLLKNPQLRGRDIRTTRAACRRAARFPTALVNFLEGTRFTPDKARRARSPFTHLMPPKVISLGIAMGEIGPRLETILNTTLCYPQNRAPRKPFIDLMCGRLREVYAHVEVLPVSPGMIGDYAGDKAFKQQFKTQIHDLWSRKDQQVGALLRRAGAEGD